jgi:hypothetical protein
MVADQILVATFAIDFRCKSVCVSPNLTTTSAGNDDREPREDLTDCTRLKPTRGSDIAPVSKGLEFSIGPVA